MSTPTVLYRADLDKMQCVTCGDGPKQHNHNHSHLTIAVSCKHRMMGSRVSYAADGHLYIRCIKCPRRTPKILLDLLSRERLAPTVVCDDPTCKEPPENHAMAIKCRQCMKERLAAIYMGDGVIEIACLTCSPDPDHLRILEHVHVAESVPS